MAKFEIDEKALQRVATGAWNQAVKKVDRDMSPYRGCSPEQVKPALERSMRRHGITPNARSRQFQKMVEVIAAGGHVVSS